MKHSNVQPRRIKRTLLFAAFLLGCTLVGSPVALGEAPLTFEGRAIETEAVLWWARALGDINGNGLTDMFLQDNNGHGGTLRWYETREGGKAWTARLIADTAPNGVPFAAGGLDAADIDNDGQLDVLGVAHPGEWKQSGAPSEIYWYQNPMPGGDPAKDAWNVQHIGGVPAFVKNTKLADFNGDGRVDLVAITFDGNRFLVYRQDAPDAWTKVGDVAIANLHEGLDVGDITGNGRPDVATNGYWVENPGGDLTGEWKVRSIDEKWHNQTGDWSRNATKVFCRDITGNGRAEVFISHSERGDYPVSWYGADDPRAGSWTEHVITDKLIAVHTLQVFDFNGDGHHDVLAGSNVGRAQALGAKAFPAIIFLNRGDNRGWDEFLLTDQGIYNGQVADLEGDGRPDIFRLPSHDATKFEVLVNQTKRPDAAIGFGDK
ncbi:MAG: FG-GAP repeat domain-containing protein [Planctomycetota bacterium]